MTIRYDTLAAASEAVTGRRAYGDPKPNFDRIACRWIAHLRNRHGIIVELDATDVAVMCIDIKLSRLEETPTHADSWVDVAGYAACGAEVSSD